MALSHILILPCCHSKCSYIVVIFICLKYKLYYAGNANYRIESTLTRGSPNTATFTWWDLGRLGHREIDHREVR
ncbi:hypothetical protein V1477_011771 [Vespula maculifrons]|uniref:Secreted protein n=1 Tax=Vespula maculifrons TaxID=7453 RepID=A0ABD2C052_VESMC